MSQRWVRGLMVLIGLAEFGVAHSQPPVRDARSIETGVELVWMADPITFPYELRAYLNDGVLEVHGVVPSSTVRKQALSIAHLYGAHPVLDLTDVEAERAKGLIAVPGDMVAAAIRSRIERALPQLADTVSVRCDDDGRVTLSGTASTHAEKMVCGEMLRRVPGCSRVDNLIQTADAVAISEPAASAVSAPVAPAVSTLAPVPAGPLVARIRLGRQDVPALLSVPIFEGQPAASERTEEMRAKLLLLCPQATGMSVRQIGPQRFQIQFVTRNEAEAAALAALIFNQTEWKQFQLDVGAQVPRDEALKISVRVNASAIR